MKRPRQNSPSEITTLKTQFTRSYKRIKPMKDGMLPKAMVIGVKLASAVYQGVCRYPRGKPRIN